MKSNKYAAFYALQRQTGLSKEALIESFTAGRTASLRALSDVELQDLCNGLRKTLGQKVSQSKPYANTKADQMRKALIALFHNMDYPNAAQAAKAWAEKQGVRGVKRRFNEYSTSELYTLLKIGDKMVADFQSSIRKKIFN